MNSVLSPTKTNLPSLSLSLNSSSKLYIFFQNLMMINARSRSPFTTSQWQELEHQALIFKYMVSGVPVPPDLISTVKRNVEYSSRSSRLFSHQPSLDWGCFQMGLGRRADAEAGRCKRTDGKKWRCSKEAYPGSKYCERHMHRGRNRSTRKNVEFIPSANPPPSVSSISIYPNTNSNSTTTTTPSYYLSSLVSSITSETPPHHHTTHLHPPLNPSPFSSRSPASSLSPQDYTAHHLFLDSASYSQADKDYRCDHGVRDEVDERCLFPEGLGIIGSLSNSKSYSNGYSQLLFHSLTDNSKQEKQEEEEEQHCFVLGTDFKSVKEKQEEEEEQHCFALGTDFKSAKAIKSQSEEEIQKPFHHFLGEWPPKSRNFWLEIDRENQSNHSLSSTTQLSIFTPLSTQELFVPKNR